MALSLTTLPAETTPVAPAAPPPPRQSVSPAEPSPISPFTLHASPFNDASPFGDFSGLLGLAQAGEARLRLQFHPKHPRAHHLDHVDACIGSLQRLTAVRKTLFEMHRQALAPAAPPRPIAPPRQPADQLPDQPHDQPADQTANASYFVPTPSPDFPSPVPAPAAPQHASASQTTPDVRAISAIRPISSIPSIPAAKDPLHTLESITATLDKWESNLESTLDSTQTGAATSGHSAQTASINKNASPSPFSPGNNVASHAAKRYPHAPRPADASPDLAKIQEMKSALLKKLYGSGGILGSQAAPPPPELTGPALLKFIRQSGALAQARDAAPAPSPAPDPDP